MTNWKKIAWGAGIGGGLIAGVTYLLRLNRTNINLETVPTVKVHKIELSGVTIRIDLHLKNPTNGRFKIKFPFVKLVRKNTTIGSSQVVDKDITIPPFGESVITQIMVKIPMLSLFSSSGGMIQDLQSGNPVKLEVKTISTIDLGWKKFPYEKTDEVTLKK